MAHGVAYRVPSNNADGGVLQHAADVVVCGRLPLLR